MAGRDQAMTDPAAIAAGLTKAQKTALPLFPQEPLALLPVSISRVTRERLVALGLVEKRSPANGFGMVRFWLSPLGLAVRAALDDTVRIATTEKEA